MKKLIVATLLFTALSANAGVLSAAYAVGKSLAFQSPVHNVRAGALKASYPARHPKQFGRKFKHAGRDVKALIR